MIICPKRSGIKIPKFIELENNQIEIVYEFKLSFLAAQLVTS
jgi:hypothetical protein